MSLAFLQRVRVDDTPDKKVAGGKGRRKQWNPTGGMKIRLWKDGSIYPSQELVDRFSLEYGPKPADKEPMSGNALDIFDSRDLPRFDTGGTTVIGVNITPKSSSKPDVFGSTTYEKDGTPKSSVMEQGAATFGEKTLIPMLKTIYGVELTDEQSYVDLVFLGQGDTDTTTPEEAGKTPWALSLQVCNMPKTYIKGEKAGQLTSVRREYPTLFILYPAHLMTGSSQDTELVTQEEPEMAEVEA